MRKVACHKLVKDLQALRVGSQRGLKKPIEEGIELVLETPGRELVREPLDVPPRARHVLLQIEIGERFLASVHCLAPVKSEIPLEVRPGRVLVEPLIF